MCGLKQDMQNMKQTMRWLSNKEDPWLLIIDNADDPDLDMAPYFPAGNRGVILLTTRNPECESHNTVGSFKCGKLLQEDAVALLLKVAAIEDLSEASRHAALDVAKTLGFLALALVQAGAFIKQRFCTIEEYCDVYSRQQHGLLSYRPVQGGSDYPYSVQTTLEISITKIKSMSSPVATIAPLLLQCFSFYHFEGIPGKDFEKAWVFNPIALNEALGENELHSPFIRSLLSQEHPNLFQRSITSLKSLSLISVAGVDGAISVHPLVHTLAPDQLEVLKRLDCWNLAVNILFSILYDGAPNHSLLMKRSRSLLPHMKSCVEMSDKDYWTLEKYTWVEAFSVVFRLQDSWEKVMQLNQMWLDTSKSVLGDEHDDVLDAMASLAGSLGAVGQRQQALELSEQVLDIRRMKLPIHHPYILESMSEVAQYLPGDRLDEAIKLNEEVLKVRRRKLGNEHDVTLISMINIASCYVEANLFQDALGLYSQVLRIQERNLGVEHSDALETMFEMARCYHILDDRQDALALYERILHNGKKFQGPDANAMLYITYFSARGCYELGQKQDAIEHFEQILSGFQELLGDEHAGTLMVADGLDRMKAAPEGDFSAYPEEPTLEITRKRSKDLDQSLIPDMVSSFTESTDRRRSRRLIEMKKRADSTDKSSGKKHS